MWEAAASLERRLRTQTVVALRGVHASLGSGLGLWRLREYAILKVAVLHPHQGGAA